MPEVYSVEPEVTVQLVQSTIRPWIALIASDYKRQSATQVTLTIQNAQVLAEQLQALIKEMS